MFWSEYWNKIEPLRGSFEQFAIFLLCGVVFSHLVPNRGHTISPNFANSLRIHMVFLNTYFDLEVGTESPHELTKSLRIWFS